MKGYIKKLLREGLSENINDELIPVKVGKFLYHKSAPNTRDKIAKDGLIPQGNAGTWKDNTPIDGNVIFATNSTDENDSFDSGYDDDIYKIDTDKLNNKWYLDPNFGKKDNQHVITFEPIPLSALKLTYRGTGEEYQ